jgi:hypothetical protein
MRNSAATLAICAFAACAAGTASAETYKWVDAQGQVHYSDRPPESGGVKVELLPAQTYHAPAVSKATAADTSRTTAGAESYSVFELASPRPGETFSNTGGTLGVQVRIEPALQPGHSLWLYLDGKRIDGLSTTGTSFELQNVWRGEHQLLAAVIDNSGKPVVTTAPVTFVMQQHSIAKPPQGPAIKH